MLCITNTNPEKKYSCEIILIGKDFSENRSTEMHCHFINYDKNLLPGMYMNAEIQLTSLKVNVLPSDAIVNYENKNYIFISKGKNNFEMRAIQTGTTENGYTEVISTDNSGNPRRYLHFDFGSHENLCVDPNRIYSKKGIVNFFKESLLLF